MTTAVITAAITDAGREMHQVSGPNQKRYADRIGAQYVVIDNDNISPSYPLAAKFQVHKIQPYFDRIVFLDVDLLVKTDCPNIFDEVPVGTVGMHDDFWHQRLWEWMYKEFRELYDSQGWTEPIPTKLQCLNTGVVVCDKEHGDVWKPPTKPYPVTHCSEQNFVNLNVHRAGYEVHLLPTEFNFQWWSHKSTFHTTDAHMLHFAGLAQPVLGGIDHPHRLSIMKARAVQPAYRG
jgi:hypothetical protein